MALLLFAVMKNTCAIVFAQLLVIPILSTVSTVSNELSPLHSHHHQQRQDVNKSPLAVPNFIPSLANDRTCNSHSTCPVDSLDEFSFNSLRWPHKDSFVRLLNKITRNANINITHTCRGSLAHFATWLKQNEPKSLLMFDASAKLRTGSFSHKLVDFGHYKQCISSTDPSGHPARYLVVKVDWHSIDVPKEYQHEIEYVNFQRPLFALCIPSQCKDGDINAVLNSSLVTQLTGPPYKLSILSSEAKGEDSFRRHRPVQSFCWSILKAILTLNIVSSVLCRVSQKCENSFISCFDVVSNTRRLITPPSDSASRTQFFCGIKVLYMYFCMCGHIFLPMSKSLLPYFHTVIDLVDDPFNAHICKLAFFIVSFPIIMAASLSVLTWLPEFEKRKGKIDFKIFVTLRVLRTYPAIIAILLLIGSFPWISIGSGGPVANYIQHFLIEIMWKNGWRELVFMSNFQDGFDMLIPVSWLVSADFQMYFASFFIVKLFYFKPQVGMKITLLTLLLAPFVHAFYLYKYQITPTIYFLAKPVLDAAIRNLYYLHGHTINHVSAYCVGLILGYILHHKIEFSEVTRKWMLRFYATSLAIFIPAICLTVDNDGHAPFGRSVQMFVAAAHKPIGSMAFAMIFYMLWYHHDSKLTKFLSSNQFVVLSRLSFAMFLVHPLQIIFAYAYKPDTFDIGMREHFSWGTDIFITSIFYGYLLHITVEAPFNQLTRRMVTKSKIKQK